ncbi:MAG: AMP nucleosidase [Acidobacteriota bacterium]
MQRPDKISRDALERYTGCCVDDFGKYILLTNFSRYVEEFAGMAQTEVKDFNWKAAHWTEKNISIIEFGIGSPVAGMAMDILSYIDPTVVLMLGMCGGIDDGVEVGDYIIPTASIRDEGTSKHYLHLSVPALPSFRVNRYISEEMLGRGLEYKSGIMKTTDYRMWEFNQAFVQELLQQRVMAIDMEIATLFAVAYARGVRIGALMLVSDLPLRREGIKTKESAREVFAKYTRTHLDIGIQTLVRIQGDEARFMSRTMTEW